VSGVWGLTDCRLKWRASGCELLFQAPMCAQSGSLLQGHTINLTCPSRDASQQGTVTRSHQTEISRWRILFERIMGTLIAKTASVYTTQRQMIGRSPVQLLFERNKLDVPRIQHVFPWLYAILRAR
jgi:hypothetical protein